jgi:hypothetical protein
MPEPWIEVRVKIRRRAFSKLSRPVFDTLTLALSQWAVS